MCIACRQTPLCELTKQTRGHVPLLVSMDSPKYHPMRNGGACIHQGEPENVRLLNAECGHAWCFGQVQQLHHWSCRWCVGLGVQHAAVVSSGVLLLTAAARGAGAPQQVHPDAEKVG